VFDWRVRKTFAEINSLLFTIDLKEYYEIQAARELPVLL
jgi:hypothetical protein